MEEAAQMKTPLLTFLLALGVLLAKPGLAEPYSPSSSFLLGRDALAKQKSEENVVFSPFSLQSAFAMTALGAEGATKKEILKVLHLTPLFKTEFRQLNKAINQPDKGVAVANRLWPAISFKLKESYQTECKNVFGAAPQTLNYAQTEKARGTINGWVAKITKDKIPELLKPGFLDSGVLLTLTNAAYFKQDWELPFPKKRTREEAFHTPEGPKQVQMMHLSAPLEYADRKDHQMVVLPYKGEFGMVLIVPKKKEGWKTMRSQLDDKLLQVPYDPEAGKVSLSLPRFKFRKQTDAKGLMISLGMKKAFTGEADFSALSDGPLMISKAVHEAFLEVNEQGTEAAAATAITMTRGMPTSQAVVVADHPFFFFIVHLPSKAVLFMGQVVDPS